MESVNLKKSGIPANPKLKQETYETAQGYTYVIQQPTFNELASAMSKMVGATGSMDFVRPGKVIFDTCCLEYSPEILEPDNAGVLVGICMHLTNTYLEGVQAEIKKK